MVIDEQPDTSVNAISVASWAVFVCRNRQIRIAISPTGYRVITVRRNGASA